MNMILYFLSILTCGQLIKLNFRKTLQIAFQYESRRKKIIFNKIFIG